MEEKKTDLRDEIEEATENAFRFRYIKPFQIWEPKENRAGA